VEKVFPQFHDKQGKEYTGPNGTIITLEITYDMKHTTLSTE